MLEFISLIQFRIAVPLGSFLFVLFWLSAFAACLFVLGSVALQKDYRSNRFYISSAVFCLLSIFIGVSAINSGKLNFASSNAELAGEWRSAEGELLLEQNGVARIQFDDVYQALTGLENGYGYWYKDDEHNLVISNPDGRKAQFKLLKLAQQYKLIRADFDNETGQHSAFNFVRSI